ncbi:MAG: hypothetical protein MJA30_01710 [Cytophagales bacterium]|nr:hypothetical protein [Cytophagales bacterium]
MFEVLEDSRPVRNGQKAVGKKNRGLPIALCQRPTLGTGLEKMANRPMTLNLAPGLLCYIQLFDRQGFNDQGARWISLSKTKKAFFIVIPASLAAR